MTNVPIKNDESRPEVDDLLSEFFRSEMPHPWPAFKAPKAPQHQKPVTFFARYTGRMALAACIALLVAGYLALSGFFPQQQAGTGVYRLEQTGHNTEKGSKVKHPITHEPRKDAERAEPPMPMPMLIPGQKIR